MIDAKIILKNDKLLHLFMIIAVYSNLLRIVVGKWAGLASDAALIALLLLVIYSKGKFKLYGKRSFFRLSIMILALQIIAMLEIFHPNILNRTYALIEYRKSIFQMLAFWVGYLLSENTDMEKHIEYLERLFIPVIFYGIKQYFWYMPFDDFFYTIQDAGAATYHYGSKIRAISFLSGPFHFGLLCSFALCVSLYLYFQRKEKKHLFLAGVCLIGCYCSQTRTNLICSIAVILFYCWRFYVKKSKREETIFKTFVIAVAIAGSLYIWNSKYITYENGNTLIAMLRSIQNFSDDSRFMGRINSWQVAWHMICEHVILGNGMGSAGDTLGYHGVAINYVTPHNMFFKIGIEMGIIGLVIFIAFFIGLFKQFWSINDKLLRYFFITCMGIVFLNAMVGSTIGTFPVITIFWLISGIAMRGETFGKDENIAYFEQ